MELAELTRWTPIRFDLSGPSPVIDWADLSQERFIEPFFDQTVARWAAGPGAAPLVRTGLDALFALDNEPSLEPAGMIFHLSRCGSTLVSQLLGTLPGAVVLAEPSPLNALLGLNPDRVDEATLVRLVRLLVRALGRCRHGNERHLVLKCTSWNIRRREVLAAAFPRDAVDLGSAGASARPNVGPSHTAGLARAVDDAAVVRPAFRPRSGPGSGQSARRVRGSCAGRHAGGCRDGPCRAAVDRLCRLAPGGLAARSPAFRTHGRW
jgi:hypothetical protein